MDKYPINWVELIHEAKSRRLGERLTQEHLAALAGVSTSTVARFENNKDIKMSSVISILDMVALIDQRMLDFPDKSAHYLSDRMRIEFWGIANDKTRKQFNKIIKCEIPHILLCDPFKVNGKDSLKIFQNKRLIIEQEARRKYLANEFEQDKPILISREDLFL